MQKKQRKTPQTWIMYKMGRNFLGDIIWQDTSLCKVYRFTIGKIFSDLQFDILFKINIIDFFFNCLKTPRVCYIDPIFIYNQFTVMMAFLF